MRLQLNKISKSFGNKEIIHKLDLEIHEGDVIGIIGKNGEGKTTLLNLITQKILPDIGIISRFPQELTTIYHEQFIPEDIEYLSIESFFMSTFTELNFIYKEINKLIDKTDDESINRSISLQQDFNNKGGYELLSKLDQILSKLGLSILNVDTKIKNLSGGQKTRLGFIKLIDSDPHLLLLDEPTNHLDHEGISWLQDFINKREGATIIVSHDRNFLNSVVNKIFDMSDMKYYLYSGNYDDYIEQKQIRENSELSLYKSKMRQIDRLTDEANKKISEAKTTDKKFIRGWEGPVIRKKAGKKAKTAQIIVKRIENQIKNDMPDKPKIKRPIKLDLSLNNPSSQMICKIKNLDYSYNKKLIIQNVNLEIWKKDRLAITGNNGSGKTTLLKLIAGELPVQEGSIKLGENIDLGYFSQEQKFLDLKNNVLDEFIKHVNMSENDARTFLHFMLFAGNQVFQKVETLSQGEKSKLSLAILISKGANFLILDEPTNHLDIPSREVLEEALQNYEGTLCVVSHDKYFLEKIGIDKVYDLNKKK